MLDHYVVQKPKLVTTDGISLKFAGWLMSLRLSNTEPLLRLNIESHGNSALIVDQIATVEAIINSMGKVIQI